ncbi:MAG: DUF2304 domain-containing protein [Nanoarchaeota archaeon]|nr:DUF2304 domain-containing protein [Nanoarchaeota archaeon]MBU1704669.1 DUF2304 domain-containing protein [Nanoarchaeota archaeon]
MLLGIQIAGVFFGLFMLYLTFLYGKRKEFKSSEGAFWIVAWIVFIGMTLFPSSVDFIVRDVLNIKRTLDFLIILGFMFLLGITFYNYYMLRKTENKIETLVRKIALEKKSK